MHRINTGDQCCLKWVFMLNAPINVKPLGGGGKGGGGGAANREVCPQGRDFDRM